MRIIKIVTNMIGENAYVALNERAKTAFVVDPGGAADEIIGACGEYRLTDILLTHGHFDHIEAVAELVERTGARVRIHPLDADMLTNTGRSLGDGRTFHAQCPADAPLPQGDSAQISVCGFDITALHTPGHTAGSVCYYIPDEAVLFSGDTLFKRGYGRTDLPTGDEWQLVRSLRALFTLPPELKVYPGHGDETTIGSEAQLYK